MKLSKVQVENYKSLKSVNLNDPLPVNMVFGVNNSGKSNVFNFISKVFKHKEEKTIVKYIDESGSERERVSLEEYPFYEGMIFDDHFLFFRNDFSKDIQFEVSIEVSEDDLSESMIDSLKLDDLYRETDSGHLNKFKFVGYISSNDGKDHVFRVSTVLLNGKVILERDTSDRLLKADELNVTTDELKDIIEIFTDCVMLIPTKRNFLVSEKFQIKNVVSDIGSNNYRNFLFNEYIDSDKNKVFNGFIEFLNGLKPSGNQIQKFPEELEYFPLEEIDLTFSRFVEEIEVMVETKAGRYPLNSYGTGTQQLLFILGFIYFKNPKVLLIEEIELNLSLIYQQVLVHILKGLVEKGRVGQVFFTSHSDQFGRNDFRHYKVSSDGDNGTSIKSIDNPLDFYKKLAKDVSES